MHPDPSLLTVSVTLVLLRPDSGLGGPGVMIYGVIIYTYIYIYRGSVAIITTRVLRNLLRASLGPPRGLGPRG